MELTDHTTPELGELPAHMACPCCGEMPTEMIGPFKTERSYLLFHQCKGLGLWAWTFHCPDIIFDGIRKKGLSKWEEIIRSVEHDPTA